MGAALDESGPLPLVILSAGDSEAKIALFGACVTSYTKAGSETLAHRLDSVMDGSKPISGGIPFCFPQFGPGALQQHGFARNVHWTLASLTDGAEPSATLELTQGEYTLGMWPHAFACTYTVTLKPDRLATEFRVHNPGDAPFEFTAALHSYLSASSVGAVTVVGGFAGKQYLDKLEGAVKTAPTSELTIGAAIDAVYEGVTGDVQLLDPGLGRQLTVSSGGGWRDTVVWNPYGNEAMGYDAFVCVESACALEPVGLAPGAEWVGTMEIVPSEL